LIREYDRKLSEQDKKTLRKEIDATKFYYPKTQKSAVIKILVLVVFVVVVYKFPTLWLIIPISIISFFMIWLLILEIKDLIQIPKFLKEKEEVIENGIAQIREINIDRYIKIKSYNDEGDHYIIEREGKLMMIGGQDFDGVRKLKNKIEYIEILDSNKKLGYNSRVVKHGQNIEPYHTFKGKLPEKLINSELWNSLTEQDPFEGKLEKLDEYIKK
jgi:hypothetical protein